jgi:PEP-CTERM motif-containing protein
MRPLALAAAALWSVAAPSGALTFNPGDLVVTGFSYEPFAPAGACTNEFCVVNPTTGVTTPFASTPDFATYGATRMIAVGSATEALALTDKALLRVNAVTGVVTPIATGLSAGGRLVQTSSGRIFVQQGALPAASTIYEVSPATGALTPFVSDVRLLASGGIGDSLTFLSSTVIGSGPAAYRPVVRLDLISGTATEIDQFLADPTQALIDLAVAPDGDVYEYAIGAIFEYFVRRFDGPSGNLLLHWDSGPGQFNDACKRVAAGAGGNLYASCDGHPLGFGFPEVAYFDAAGDEHTIDLDFGIGAFGVANVPEPGTAALLALGLAALARARRGARRR